MTGGDDERDGRDDGEVERKERILHTRVPPSLDRQLRRRARGLGLTVSTVVRHILLNTFGLVEDIVTDGTNVALALAGDLDEVPPPARGARPPATPAPDAGDAADAGADDVLGWHGVILNRNAVCDRCNAVLRRGGRAAVAVSEGPGPRRVICRRCLARIAAPPPVPRGHGRRIPLPAAGVPERRRRRREFRPGGA